MAKQSLSEKEKKPPIGVEGSKTNRLEDSLNDSSRDSQDFQGCQEPTDVEMLSEAIAVIEDTGVYLFATKAQKVRGGYRFYAVDVLDVGRAA